MKINKNITSVNFTAKNERKIEFIVVHYTAGKSDYEGAAYDNTCYFSSPQSGGL